MASYYDAYDSRPRPSRRHESLTRSKDESYLKPTAGASEPRQRVGERPSDGQNNGYGSERPANRPSYDPRYHYPPPLPPDTGRPQRQPPSPNRKRFTWPPQPTCEDEATALAKEAGTQKVLSEIRKDEARSRGTVDQWPIVKDVPEFIGKDERAYVVTSDSDSKSTTSNLPTPPTSEDEKARKANRRPSRLSMKFDNRDSAVPEMSRRAASSPYTYRPTKTAQDDMSFDRFLSPDSILSPRPTDSRSRRGAPFESRSQPTSPRRDSARYSPPNKQCKDYFNLSSGESAIDDTDYDTSDSMSKSNRNKPSTHPRIPMKKTEVPSSNPRTSTIDFASQPSAMPVRRLNLDSRRNTDTANTLPTLRRLRVDNARRPPLLMASSALSQLNDFAIHSSPTTIHSAAELPLPRSRVASRVPSPAVSPAGSAVGVPGSTTPPRSPRISTDFGREQNSRSLPGSREGSISGSRPSSPSPRTPVESPRLPRTDVDWTALMVANAARRAKPPSRLSAEFRQGPMSAAPRLDTRQRPVMRTDSLPYPIDNGPATPTVFMPSERMHQYVPETRSTLQLPVAQEPRTLSRSTSPARTNSSFTSTASMKTARPAFHARHSTTEVPQDEREKRQQVDRPRAIESRRVSFNTPAQSKRDLLVLMKKGLPPPCARSEPGAGHGDWYTLVGAPSLDFCPDCIDSVFERTLFRPCFRRSPPHNLNTKIQCALGGMPWIRLAWLLTLRQQRTDLDLLKDVAEIEETTAECPGHEPVVRSWYSLRDPDGLFVKDFHICYSDVRKIERVLPSLSGLFVRLPTRASIDKQICAIHPEGNRFSVYIDALAVTHENAVASRRGADPVPLINLVKRRQRLRECTRDSLLINGLWHFIPALPELTVCEDCYETLVEPEVQKNNDLAMRFNRTVQPVYGEDIGSSCQLYSRRMRRVFDRAVQDKDFRYLARKAKERREAELRLQYRYLAARQKAKRLSREDSEGEYERRLDWEISRITKEWKNEWE